MWTFTNGPPAADMALLIVGANGQAKQLRWTVANPPVGAVYRFALSDPSQQLQVDQGGDGSMEGRMTPVQAMVNELAPTLIAVEQDLTVIAGRPAHPCAGPSFGNYGTVVAVVFSKPMTQASAGPTESYTLDGENGANSVQVQPSGRVALLNLRKGISAIRPRTLTVRTITDVRGNPLVGGVKAVRSVYPGTATPFTGGGAVRGRVLKGDGAVAAGVPVTLTMYDQVQAAFGCEAWTRRVSQVLTDANGSFDFDFVMAGIPYSISATDTSGLTPDAIKVILESTAQNGADRQHLERLANSKQSRDTLLGLFAASSLPEAIAKVEGLDRALVRDLVVMGSGREGQQVPIALRFRGRASVIGQVVAADGATPIPEAAVNLFPDPDSREQGRGLLSDSDGRFAFFGVPLGVFTIDVKTSDRRVRTVTGLLDAPGQVTNVSIAVPSVASAFGTLRGRVFEADNLTPHGNARVFVGKYSSGESKVIEVVRIVEADAEGSWEAPEIPVRAHDVVAVTLDGKRKGVRLNITPNANTVTYANITLSRRLIL